MGESIKNYPENTPSLTPTSKRLANLLGVEVGFVESLEPVKLVCSTIDGILDGSLSSEQITETIEGFGDMECFLYGLIQTALEQDPNFLPDNSLME